MYQRGSLKKVPHKAGETWVLRYRVTSGERRVVRINEEAEDTRTHLDALAEHYLKVDMGKDAVRPKSLTTVPIVEHYVRDYVCAQWSQRTADEIKPLDIQK